MSVIKVTAEVFVDIGDREPNDVCSELDSGLEGALQHFPGGDILMAQVEGAVEASDAEIREYGLDEI